MTVCSQKRTTAIASEVMEDAPVPFAATLEPPIAVLSDLHLGHPATYLNDPAMIRPLLQSARTVIFNGDVAELVVRERAVAGRERLKRLAEVCHEAGVRPIFITGNHDPNISNAHYLDLFGGKVFLTHGDILHRGVAPWSRDARALNAERKRLLAGRPFPTDLDEWCVLAKRMSLVAAFDRERTKRGWPARIEMVGRFAIQPWRIVIALNYWASVARYCRKLRRRHRPSCRLLLIGHTHRAGFWWNRDFTVINTGSFQPLSRALVTILDEHRAIAYETVRDEKGYSIGRELHHVSLKE